MKSGRTSAKSPMIKSKSPAHEGVTPRAAQQDGIETDISNASASARDTQPGGQVRPSGWDCAKAQPLTSTLESRNIRGA